MTRKTSDMCGTLSGLATLPFVAVFQRRRHWRQRAVSPAIECYVSEMYSVFRQSLYSETLATKLNVVKNTCGDMATFAYRHVACRRVAMLGGLTVYRGHALQGLAKHLAAPMGAWHLPQRSAIIVGYVYTNMHP